MISLIRGGKNHTMSFLELVNQYLLRKLQYPISHILILIRKQKVALVIKLAEKRWTIRAIAKYVHLSLKDIGTILREHTKGDIEISVHQMSKTSNAFKHFKEGKSKVDVANY